MTPIEFAYRAFCKGRFPLPSEADVAGLERRIGIALPPDYRRFLLEYNGGYFTEPDISPVDEGCPEDCLAFMSGVGASVPCAELGRLGMFDDNDPARILGIGYTLMGNLILMVTDPDDDNGFIALKRASSDEVYFLANGIENFFGLFREPSDE